MPPLSVHGRIVLASLLPFVLFGLYVGLRSGMTTKPGTVDIAVQAPEATAVTFTVASKGSVRLIDVTHSSTKPIALSAPASWTRGEVRDAPITDVTHEEASLGYVRWRLPPRATVSFRTNEPFIALRVHNPNAIPLTARLTAVDLVTSVTYTDATLLQDASGVLPLTAPGND